MKKEDFYREAITSSVGPLEGVRVLEATVGQSGPIAGMVLADLGAEVIKIDPAEGDIHRRLAPFVGGTEDLERSTWHLTLNRNKKNITLSLETPQGQGLFRKVLAEKRIDILIENFRSGTMAKWGLGYQDLRKVKPDLIYTSITARGQFGQGHDRPSYDPEGQQPKAWPSDGIGQAESGLMHVTGRPEDPPTRSGYLMGDVTAGWQAAFAALAALRNRDQTGEGQWIDIAQRDSVAYCSDMFIMASANAGVHWQRYGSGLGPAVAPANAYRCDDGNYAYIAIVLDAHWARFCKVMGREDLIEDSRTATQTSRAQNWQFVDGLVADWARGRTAAEVVRALDEIQVVVAHIQDFQQLLQDGHFKERDMVAEVDHPQLGRVQVLGVGTKFSVTPARVRTAAPLLGQHNEEIYCGVLDLSAEEMIRFKEQGVI